MFRAGYVVDPDLCGDNHLCCHIRCLRTCCVGCVWAPSDVGGVRAVCTHAHAGCKLNALRDGLMVHAILDGPLNVIPFCLIAAAVVQFEATTSFWASVALVRCPVVVSMHVFCDALGPG